jgi:hypothetical protein
MAAEMVSKDASYIQIASTYNLELQRNDSEVEDLYRRPEHEIRLQCWQVHILKLPRHGSSSAAFGDCHECEEEC